MTSALSFRLLRYINSAFFGLRFEISSIGQALALLGVENLRRWATLTVLASIDGKPPELTVTALVRARFCELAGEQLPGPRPGELFTLGLFSVIDALMDAPIEDVIALIPFPADMREALVNRSGEKGALLESRDRARSGRVRRSQRLVRGAGDLYLEALMWAGDAAWPLFQQPAAAHPLAVKRRPSAHRCPCRGAELVEEPAPPAVRVEAGRRPPRCERVWAGSFVPVVGRETARLSRWVRRLVLRVRLGRG